MGAGCRARVPKRKGKGSGLASGGPSGAIRREAWPVPSKASERIGGVEPIWLRHRPGDQEAVERVPAMERQVGKTRRRFGLRRQFEQTALPGGKRNGLRKDRNRQGRARP
jgi:hypothetical protein